MKKNHLSNRLLSLLCCLCLVVSLLVPMTALAADTEGLSVTDVEQMPFVNDGEDNVPNDGYQQAVLTYTTSAPIEGYVKSVITAADGKSVTYIHSVKVKFTPGGEPLAINVANCHDSMAPADPMPTATLELYLCDDNNGTNPVKFYSTDTWQRTRQWEFYLSQTMHTDLGYTDYQEDLPVVYTGFLETVRHYMDTTDKKNYNELYKYAIESQWVLDGYMSQTTAEEIEAIQALMKNGRMIVGGAMGNQAQETFGTEDVARATYFTNRLMVDKLGIEPSTVARMFDNPAFSKSYVDAANSAGIKYGIHAMNHDHSPYYKEGLYNLYYMDGNVEGSKLLIFNGESYNENYGFGGNHAGGYQGSGQMVYDFLLNSHNAFNDGYHDQGLIYELEGRTTKNEEAGRTYYPYDKFPLLLIPYGDNKWPSDQQIQSANEFNDIIAGYGYDYPHVKAAFPEEFFADVEEEYGDIIPHRDGTEENWWNHGWGTTAYESGVNKLAGAELPVAETAASLATALAGAAYPYDDLNEGMLRTQIYDEHTWGWNSYDNSNMYNSQWEWKRSNAFGAKALADKVLESSLDTLAKQKVQGNGQSIYVYNGLNWERNDVVTVKAPEGFQNGWFILDGTESVPYTLKDGELTFVAKGVPAMGYKIFTVSAEAGRAPTETYDAVQVDSNTISNGYYTIQFAADGTISSIIDKSENREMVDQDAVEKFNQYRYYDCKGQNYNGYAYNAMYTPEESTAILEIDESDNKVTATVTTSTFRTPSITQTVTLYDGIDRIDIVNEVVKDPHGRGGNATEDVFYTFPFNVDGGYEIRYDLPVGNTAEGDQVYGTSHDWYTVNKWTSVCGDDGYNMVLASPNTALMQFGERRTELWDFDYVSKKPYLYSWLFNNMWQTNFQQDQPGYADFRYSISSNTAGRDMEQNNRFGWEISTPLQATVVDGTAQKASDSYFKIDNSNVTVSTMKAAEANGEGMILRFTEVAGKGGTVNVTLPYSAAITETDIIENNLTGGVTASGTTFTFTVEPYEFKTFRIVKSDAAALGQVTGVQAVTQQGTSLVPNSYAHASSFYNAFPQTPYWPNNAERIGDGREWAAEGNVQDPEIEFVWDAPQTIAQIILADRNGKIEELDTVTVTLSSEDAELETYTISDVKNDEYTYFTLPTAVSGVTRMKLVVHGVSGCYGLEGVAAYSTQVPDSYDPADEIPGTKVTWNAVSGAAYYEIFRKPAGSELTLGEEGTYLASTTETSFFDTQVVDGLSKRYEYGVRAVGAGSAGSITTATNTLGHITDNVAPATPIVHGIIREDNRIDIWWTPVTDNTYIDHYEVYCDGQLQELLRVDSYLVSYRDKDVDTSKPHTYEVVAVDAYGNKSAAGTVTIAPQADSSAKLESLSLTWNDENSTAVALSSAFDPNTRTYTVAVGENKMLLLPGVKVAYTAPAGAVVTIDGAPYDEATGVYAIDAEHNMLNIKVEMPDGARQTYRITFVEADPIITVAGATAPSTWPDPPVSLANLYNNSGMSDAGSKQLTLDATHSSTPSGADMWHTNSGATHGEVTFDLGAVYPLDKMYVWNMNQHQTEGNFPGLERRGLKNVKIEYSLTGEENSWQELKVPENMQFGEATAEGYPFQFAKAGDAVQSISATNLNDGSNSPVDFGGVSARYVRITSAEGVGNGNWGNPSDGNHAYYGLSEVRFTTKIPYSEGKPVNEIAVASENGSTEITAPNGNLQMVATVIPDDATYKDVTWSVLDENGNNFAEANEAPATIDQDGLLTAYRNGTVTVAAISAQPAEDGSTPVKGTVQITISGQPEVIEDVVATAGEWFNQDSENEDWKMQQHPSNLVSGKGLDIKNSVYAHHDNESSGRTMWHTDANPDENAWVEFDLGSDQEISRMYIWNFNQNQPVGNYADLERRGLKDVKIEYKAADDADWTVLTPETGNGNAEYPITLSKASGENGIGYTDAIDLFVKARYIRITADPTVGEGNYGEASDSNLVYYGLSEVMFTKGEETPEEPTITGVTISPVSVSVEKGKTQQFAATVSGTGDYNKTVAWTVTGGAAGTSIDENGLLTVAAAETAKTLTVKAAAAGDETKFAEATVTVTEVPVVQYTLTVVGGIGSGSYAAGTEITVKANEPESGKHFKAWEAKGITLADPSQSSVTITMPANDVTLTATYEEDPVEPTIHTITLNPNGGRVDPDTLTVKDGETVELPIPTRFGSFRFVGWFTSAGKEVTDETHIYEDLTLVARWQYTGGGSHNPVEPEKPVEPSEPEDESYFDVSVGDWYYDAVEYVREQGLMDGVGNGRFNPDGSVSRAMVWTVLARMDGEDTDGGATWYSKAQEWAMRTGVSDGTNPMGSITREQLAAMLYRYEGSPAMSGNLDSYPDASTVSDWAVDAMVWATETGLINGINGYLKPKAGATRAQLAAMLMRMN